jgi:hypothetical protein
MAYRTAFATLRQYFYQFLLNEEKKNHCVAKDNLGQRGAVAGV